MDDRFTTTAALTASRAGTLDAWIHAFLNAAGRNPALSDGLRLEERKFHGPLTFPLDVLTRCTGPEPGMTFQVSAEGFEERVGRIAAAVRAGRDLPPLLVNYQGGRFVVNDGNHRLEAFRRLSRVAGPVIVWTTGASDALAFTAWWCRERSGA